jgi:hypothetical protein
MGPSLQITCLAPCLPRRQAREGTQERSHLGGSAPTTGPGAGRPEVGAALGLYIALLWAWFFTLLYFPIHR